MQPDMDAIVTKVRGLVAEGVRRPLEGIPIDARLDATQLGIDSLGLITLSVRLEEAFDITLPDLLDAGGRPAVETVRDVAALVAGQIEKRGHSR